MAATTNKQTTETQTKADPMDKIVEGLETKSSKIRALSAANYTRSQIAKYLDIRYQHVRNVLVNPPKGQQSQSKGDDQKSA